MTTESKRYNGWANYETWAVKLWMDNEEGTYNYWREEAASFVNQHEGEEDMPIHELADQLKSEHEEALPELRGFAADLLTAAFGEVDWFEIAQALVEEAKE